MNHQIPKQANRVLNIIILSLLLIFIRVWYLSIIQHEVHVELSLKPQRKSTIERVERGTIRDRFNIPLALNKLQYVAAICYADIRSIPSVKWEKGTDGKPKRTLPRLIYIKELSQLLAKELDLNEQDIEDTIHGKASLFPHTPFILKEGISEKVYYRLKFLESTWRGIHTDKRSKRYYPLGKVGSDIIGYMGAISSHEYLAIAKEIKILQTYLNSRELGEIPILPKGFQNALEVRERLKQLQEKSYTIHDLVGKSGIEASFDEELRGYFGKKIHAIDIKGNILHELPGGRKSVSGQRLLLSISSELQEYAEQLLAQHEKFRETPNSNGIPNLSQPWIKGGAIVALDAKTGEVLALASYPRFDPNDFISSHQNPSNVFKWLENEAYIGEIWDGKCRLERERFNTEHQQFYDEILHLNWEHYLEAVFSKKSAIFATMQQIRTIDTAYQIQKTLDELLLLSKQSNMQVLLAALYSDHTHPSFAKKLSAEKIKQAHHDLSQHLSTQQLKSFLDPYLAHIMHQDDQLIAIDLCALMIDKTKFTPELLSSIGHHTLSQYKELSQWVTCIQSELQTHARNWFHQIDFQRWREEEFKEFLKTKRKEEKEKKQYIRPYTEYLEQLERDSFKRFWDQHRSIFVNMFIFGANEALHYNPALEPYIHQIKLLRQTQSIYTQKAEKLQAATASLPPSIAYQYIQSMRSFQDLNRPLYGHYRRLRHTNGIQLEKHLAGAFYPLSGFSYGRSHAFRQSTPLGSVFKVVVAYQALLEKYQQLHQLGNLTDNINPLTLIDDMQWTSTPGSNQQILGYFLDGTPIHRLYKGGRLPRAHPNIGKIDVIGALEQSSNMYFSILAAEHIENPWNLIEVCRLFGLGERSGIEIPGEIAGMLPDDISHNRTGLYSFAMGQHSLIATPLQTAIMLAAIANKGEVLMPKIVQIIAGHEPITYEDPFTPLQYPYQESLNQIGVEFSLFTAVHTKQPPPQVWYLEPEIKRSLFMPNEIRDPLIEGMHKVINGTRGTARPHIIRFLNQNTTLKKNFQELKGQLIGKTGTAEILYKPTIDAESKAQIHNHIWFGGVSFTPSSYLSKIQSLEPEIAVAVYLRLSSSGGKEAVPLATEIIKKWQEICEKHGCRGYISAQK